MSYARPPSAFWSLPLSCAPRGAPSPAPPHWATAIMDRSAVNIAERGAAYRQAGWKSFNPTAPPYTAEQIRKEATCISGDKWARHG